MAIIRPDRINAFAGATLDRASHLRKDTAWLDQAWRNPAAQIVAVWQQKALIRGTEALTLPAAWGRRVLAEQPSLPWIFLGLDGADPVFAIDLTDYRGDELPLPEAFGSFLDLLMIAGTLPPAQAALHGYAKAMTNWRARHRFCGLCGAQCTPQQAGHVMVCTACGTQHFPRTDPTVIMLVTKDDRILLGRAPRFPHAMYSTLAGFVEPGESLEEAVAREVREETNIRLGAIHYHSGQPWPFPSNLMLGFIAEATTDAITIDPDELSDARWFTRADLATPAANGFSLPPPHSIARHMIDGWCAGPASGP